MNSAFTRKVPNPGQFVHDLECGKNICARKITYISIMTRNVIYGRICFGLYFYTNIYIQSLQNEQSNNGCKSTYNDNSRDLVQNNFMAVDFFNNIPIYKIALADFFSFQQKENS